MMHFGGRNSKTPLEFHTSVSNNKKTYKTDRKQNQTYTVTFLSVTNLRHTFLNSDMLQSSACFEQYYAHLQEVKLYVYSVWYLHSV